MNSPIMPIVSYIQILLLSVVYLHLKSLVSQNTQSLFQLSRAQTCIWWPFPTACSWAQCCSSQSWTWHSSSLQMLRLWGIVWLLGVCKHPRRRCHRWIWCFYSRQMVWQWARASCPAAWSLQLSHRAHFSWRVEALGGSCACCRSKWPGTWSGRWSHHPCCWSEGYPRFYVGFWARGGGHFHRYLFARFRIFFLLGFLSGFRIDLLFELLLRLMVWKCRKLVSLSKQGPCSLVSWPLWYAQPGPSQFHFAHWQLLLSLAQSHWHQKIDHQTLHQLCWKWEWSPSW